jgi:hypothetical protein
MSSTPDYNSPDLSVIFAHQPVDISAQSAVLIKEQFMGLYTYLTKFERERLSERYDHTEVLYRTSKPRKAFDGSLPERAMAHNIRLPAFLTGYCGVHAPGSVVAGWMNHDSIEDVEECTLEQLHALCGNAGSIIVQGLTIPGKRPGIKTTPQMLEQYWIQVYEINSLWIDLGFLADHWDNGRTVRELPEHRQREKLRQIREECMKILERVKTQVPYAEAIIGEHYEKILTYSFALHVPPPVRLEFRP